MMTPDDYIREIRFDQNGNPVENYQLQLTTAQVAMLLANAPQFQQQKPKRNWAWSIAAFIGWFVIGSFMIFLLFAILGALL
jgi:hypothetical protein